jgi:chromosome segregation ATPase
MVEVSGELILEILKQLQGRMSSFEKKADEIKSALQALRIHSLPMQQDTQNIYSMLTRHDGRFDRIERRLEISEVTG